MRGRAPYGVAVKGLEYAADAGLLDDDSGMGLGKYAEDEGSFRILKNWTRRRYHRLLERDSHPSSSWNYLESRISSRYLCSFIFFTTEPLKKIWGAVLVTLPFV